MLQPEEEASKYLKPAFTTDQGDNPGVEDAKAALEGARQILMERFAEDAALLQWLREYLAEAWRGGIEDHRRQGGCRRQVCRLFRLFRKDRTIPSHRALALFRGRREEMLTCRPAPGFRSGKAEMGRAAQSMRRRILAAHFGIRNKNRPADEWLNDTVRWTWRVKIFLHLETELMSALRKRAETEAINVFARNLKALLLAAPAGPRATMGLDPGLRTGVKVAVVDATGKVMETATIYPHQPSNDWDGSLHALGKLAERYRVSLISIGNGTASRETDKLAKDLIKQRPELKLT